jgi:hypothetical protein
MPLCLPLDLHLTKEENYMIPSNFKGKPLSTDYYQYALFDTISHIPEFWKRLQSVSFL